MASISTVALGLLYTEDTDENRIFLLELVFYGLLLVNLTFIVRWAINMG